MNDLIHLLLISAITSLQIVFIHILFWPGMILEFMRENRLPLLVQKPLYECVICMTSFWGFLFWLFEWQMSVNLIQFWFVVGGINVLLSGIIGRAEDVNGEMFVQNNSEFDSFSKEDKKRYAEYKKHLDERFEKV